MSNKSLRAGNRINQFTTKQVSRILLAAAIALLASACGGGGGTDPAVQTAPGKPVSASADAGTGTAGTAANTSTTTTTTTTSTTTSTTLRTSFSEGVLQSWQSAVAYLPGTSTRIPVGQIPKNQAYSVLIFMHGCAGMASHEHANWGTLLAAQGLLVVMPDSMVRNDRQSSCGDLSEKGGPFPQIHDMRLDEIVYASQEIRKQPWFNGKHLMLMGYSEGAIAAVRTQLSGLRGVIATSWTCTHWNLPALHGIYLPKETPLLTLRRETDTWFTSNALNSHCGERMAGYADAKNIMVPGAGHGTYDDPQARQEVVQFILRLLNN